MQRVYVSFDADRITSVLDQLGIASPNYSVDIYAYNFDTGEKGALHIAIVGELKKGDLERIISRTLDLELADHEVRGLTIGPLGQWQQLMPLY
jgi:hypothetical protein